MIPKEISSVISLSAIMGLRIIGLFMVLPVFTLYANELPGATPFLIGLSLGIYGLAQAFFQIPLGMLSDVFGRKPIILLGLLCFAMGSLVAGMATDMTMMLLGRSLQGMGAIGSVLLAYMADLTSEKIRTKAMAIAGMTIGFAFLIAMMLGPLLLQWINVADLFFLAAGFALIAITILLMKVPSSPKLQISREKPFLALLIQPPLAHLNAGIFILHAIFTASFLVIPIHLANDVHLPANTQWLAYVPALLFAGLISFSLIGSAEQKNRLGFYFMLAICMLLLAQLLFWFFAMQFFSALISLGLFFTGFSLLEAFLPSLVSRLAPPYRKGTALGFYSAMQFLGIFVGGTVGGYLFGIISDDFHFLLDHKIFCYHHFYL